METGVLGLQLPPAVSLVEREHKTAPDFATIQHHPTEEQIALGKAQKMLLAIHSCVPLVKKFNLTIFAILSRLEKI